MSRDEPIPDVQHALTYGLPELVPVRARELRDAFSGSRLNLAIPVLHEKWTYGGAATALRFFRRLAERFESARLILLNQTQARFDFESWPGWVADKGTFAPRSVACLGEPQSTLSVCAQDFFIATFWSTALYLQQVLARQRKMFPGTGERFVYFIQDYEAGFYPWSPRYVYANSSYSDPQRTIAVFNSQPLADYFSQQGYSFSRQHVLEPILNPSLRQAREAGNSVVKDRVIVVYGRPSTPRNGFGLIAEALKIWADTFPSAAQWSLVSAGEQHDDVPLGKGMVLRSAGKMSLEEYARLLSRAWVGLSFMFSPHPSYPPLELAEFGAWSITNKFANKDLSTLAPNIVSLDDTTPTAVAERLAWCCEQYRANRRAAIDDPVSVFRANEDEFPFADDLVASWRRQASLP